ncbi:MAG: FG-GAP-like repeat-containing protein, partial [Candidatus Zixiibacteriota bacterium]
MYKVLLTILLILFMTSFADAQFSVVSTSPSQHEISVISNSEIDIIFNDDVDMASVDAASFIVYSQILGYLSGTYSSPNTLTARFTPDGDFLAGDLITVTIRNTIEQDPSHDNLDKNYIYSFIVGVGSHNQGGFVLDSVYSTGDLCYHITVADYNNDGYPDLSTANQGDENISVYLNNGNGTFGSYATYSTSGDPRTTIAGDVNKDGWMDIVTANAFSDSVSVYLNDGDGTFAPEILYRPHGVPINAHLADLDADGDLDMFVTNNQYEDISIYKNNGSGVFGNRVDYAIPSVNRLVATDIDNDFDLDIVSANTGAHNVAILPNNGNASFGSYSTEATANDPWGICAGDFDEDGYIDIATGNGWQYKVCILTNDQLGGLNSYISYPTWATSWLDRGDIDGDNDLDITCASVANQTLSVMLNNGNAVYDEINMYDLGGLRSYAIQFADLDLDGDLDIVSVNYDSDDISVFINEPFPKIVSTLPDQNETDVPVNFDISLTTDLDIDPATITDSSFIVNGNISGRHSGTISYDSPSQMITFDPDNDFTSGEVVTVMAGTDIKSTYGTGIENNYYIWTFSTEVSDISSGQFVLDSNYTAGDSCHGIYTAD